MVHFLIKQIFLPPCAVEQVWFLFFSLLKKCSKDFYEKKICVHVWCVIVVTSATTKRENTNSTKLIPRIICMVRKGRYSKVASNKMLRREKKWLLPAWLRSSWEKTTVKILRKAKKSSMKTMIGSPVFTAKEWRNSRVATWIDIRPILK